MDFLHAAPAHLFFFLISLFPRNLLCSPGYMNEIIIHLLIYLLRDYFSVYESCECLYIYSVLSHPMKHSNFGRFPNMIRFIGCKRTIWNSVVFSFFPYIVVIDSLMLFLGHSEFYSMVMLVASVFNLSSTLIGLSLVFYYLNMIMAF